MRMLLTRAGAKTHEEGHPPVDLFSSAMALGRRIVAMAASYAAKGFGIKTGTLVREAQRLCPDIIPVQANHQLYTDYHDRILAAVDTCLPVEKVCSIDKMACRLMGSEQQMPAARRSKSNRRWATNSARNPRRQTARSLIA